MKSLLDIAIFHSPSKLDHSYIQYIYPRYFEPIRNKELKVLEIGVKGGQSLTMWEEYFPNSQIYGLDKRTPHTNLGPRIKEFQGDQADTNILKSILSESGPLDIVVDDGSHRSRHQIPSFKYLFPRMRKHGLYCVEDLHVFHEGIDDAGWELKNKTIKDHKFVSLMYHYTKWLLMSHKYWDKIDKTDEDHKVAKHIRAIHFYDKMIIIEKA